MGIVSCSGNRFDEPCSDHGAFQITGTALDELRPVVGELPFVFIEPDGITQDGTHRRRGDGRSRSEERRVGKECRL